MADPQYYSINTMFDEAAENGDLPSILSDLAQEAIQYLLVSPPSEGDYVKVNLARIAEFRASAKHRGYELNDEWLLEMLEGLINPYIIDPSNFGYHLTADKIVAVIDAWEVRDRPKLMEAICEWSSGEGYYQHPYVGEEGGPVERLNALSQGLGLGPLPEAKLAELAEAFKMQE